MTAPLKHLSEPFKKKEGRGRRRVLAGIRLGKKIMKSMDQEKKEILGWLRYSDRYLLEDWVFPWR